ncbi:MFS transporter [Horticoccus sp. 23ND18S-11]|uniref:MFS transporter n=1 Tax=Horticoccus sp. 23ND18S-11 TaxID=3391832 RepID=UPI0039C8DF46
MLSQPWRVALFLFVAAGLNYADRTALSSVIPPLRQDLGATDVQIGIAGMLFLWTYAIASPFAGNLADRFSRSRIVLWSLVTWSVITIATGLVQSVMMLFVLRTALGIAESFYLPAAGALLGDHHGPATRGRAMGFHMLGLNLGLVLGGSAAGLMAEHYGWRLGFWVLGAVGLLLALAARFLLSDGPAKLPPAAGGVSPSSAREAWTYLMRVPSFHCLLLSAMVAGVASWIFLSWLPLFFAENYGMKLGAAGLAGVALYKGPVFIGIALGGWLSDRVAQRNARGRALIKGLSFIVSAPFLFLFIGAPTFALVATMMIVSSIIRAIGLPSEHPIVCEVVPPQFRSTAIGILNTCGSAAGGVGVLLAGIFKKDLGLNVIFGASSFIYILAGVLMLVAYWFSMAKDMQRAEAFAAASGRAA